MSLIDGAQVDILYSLDSEIMECRLWFISHQPPITQSTLDDLAIGVGEHFRDQLMPFLSHNLGLIRVDARDWTEDPPPFTSIHNVFQAGGNTSASHSANVAVRVVFNGASNQDFRDNSNFIPGIPISEVDINRYSAALKDAIFECYVNLIDATSFFGPFPAWRWVITSRRLNNAWRPTQHLSRTDIIHFTSPFVSPRRRRLP